MIIVDNYPYLGGETNGLTAAVLVFRNWTHEADPTRPEECEPRAPEELALEFGL